MEREYVRGNKEHWKEIYEWAFGTKSEEVPDAEISYYAYFAKDTCVILKRSEEKLFFVDKKKKDDKALYDVITTNPHWHEVKPWEKHYEPKPFDKVLGWYDNENAVFPDIFLYKAFDTYSCARDCFNHVKPYDEEEYLKSLENTDNE